MREELKRTSPSCKPSCARLIRDQINDLMGVSSPVEVKLFGPDPAVLRQLAEQVGKLVEECGAEDVNPHVHLGNPDLVVRPDQAALARSGLTEQDVESQLNAALYGQVASTLPEQDRITNIRVRYPDRVRFDRGTARPTAHRACRGRPAKDPAGGTSPPGFVLARTDLAAGRGPQPQRGVAREPAAGDHGQRRAGRPRPGNA